MIKARIQRLYYRFHLQDWIGPVWTILFALVGLLDFAACFPRWVDGWMEGRKQSKDHFFLIKPKHAVANGTEFCPVHAIEEEDDCQRLRWISHHAPTIGVLFCVLCMVESVRRAREARQTALDMAALDEFEKTLARLYSATKFTVFRSSPSSGEQDAMLTRKFVRVWTPVVSHLFGWCILLPWPILISMLLPRSSIFTTGTWIPHYHYLCGDDPAMATVWIRKSTTALYETMLVWNDQFTAWVWKVALPVQLWMKPISLIQRLRLLSRWIRYFRYAGPLLRLLLKLQDQFWVFGKTWKQAWKIQAEKAKRLASRSMLFQDIQRLESLAKLQTRLASLPSQFKFAKQIPLALVSSSSSTSSSLSRSGLGPNLAMTSIASTDDDDDDDDNDDQHNNTGNTQNDYLHRNTKYNNTTTSNNNNNDMDYDENNPFQARPGAAILLAQRKEESRRLQRRINFFKRHVRQWSSNEIYDRMVELTQEVKRTLSTAVWNKNLISPHTRFSVAWRICVTLALLSELGRLLFSWQVSGTFDLRYSDLTRRILGLCQTKSHPVRKWIGKLVRLPPNHPWLDTCRQSSPSSQLSLSVAWWSEIAIDLIGFLDIFVWFYTGELDPTGLVVPKPFFYRCILPGTLTQVLDHPTVPQALPNLLQYFWKASRAVGYSRVVRWGLAWYPALDLLLLSPVHHYLFHPMDKDEYLSYTESLVQFTSKNSLLKLKLSFNNTNNYTNNNSNYFKSSRNLSTLHSGHEEDDFSDLHSFIPQQRSYSNVFHESISENDGYGLYY